MDVDGPATSPAYTAADEQRPLTARIGLVWRQPRMEEAWLLVALGFIVTLFSTGIRFSVGPFIAPMMEDFQLTRSQISAVVAAATLLFGLGLPLCGRLADVLGARIVLIAGIFVVSGSLWLTSRTTSPFVFAVTYAALASIGFAATSQVVLSSLISRWFRKRRGLATMFLSSGAMGGIALMTPLSAALIERLGWRDTYFVLAAFMVVVLLPATWLIIRQERPPEEGEPSPGGGAAGQTASVRWQSALVTAPFWYLGISFFACGFSMNLLGVHGVPMLEHHGFATVTASLGIGMIGLVSIFGTLAMGVAADRLGRPLFLALIYFVRGAGFIGLLVAGREWELFTVAAVGGLVWAGSAALTSAITADFFGAQSVGTLFGLLFLVHQVGASAGAFFGGWGFQSLGSYALPFTLATVLLLVGGFLCVRLPGLARAVSTTTPKGMPLKG